MFTSNPFAELSATISPSVMQTYVTVMALLVAGGTLFDVWHKGSAKYFFGEWKKGKEKSSGLKSNEGIATHAFKTVAEDVLTSAEFCNPNRRLAHLLTMYGFIAYVAATVAMVFWYPTSASAGLWPFLWVMGALAVCVGGYWFWFFIRVDVAAEGNSPFRFVRADLFVVSLVLSTTLALIWAATQSWIWLGLYLIATTILFGGIPWSKFSHMFFKPAAAMQKRVAAANGSRRGLPAPADSPEVFTSARREPRNY